MLANRDRILIVSASVGAGHMQAAGAMEAAIKRRYPMSSTKIVDFMAGESSYLNTLVKETYLKMLSLSPNIYDLLYRWSQNRQYPRVQNLVARAMNRSMLRLYRQYRPDIIVCTHPFPCGAAAYLRRTHKINIPLVGIITDYAVHQMWVYNEVDLYFVAEEELQAELVKRGPTPGRVFPTGIPIDASFGHKVETRSVAAELGLTAGLFTVLVMGGGIGIGPIQEVICNLDSLDSPLQIVVVAGRNANLRRQLNAVAQRSRHHVVVLGYTQLVRELMAIADLLVTKPGALTVSEALALSLPMVLFSPIPGQEEDNAKFLVRRGAAIPLARIDALGSAIRELLSRPEILESMRVNAGLLGQPGAADMAAAIMGRYLQQNRLVAESR